jgi:hypothetical protein
LGSLLFFKGQSLCTIPHPYKAGTGYISGILKGNLSGNLLPRYPGHSCTSIVMDRVCDRKKDPASG